MANSVELLVRVLTIKYMYFVSRWVIDDLPVLVTCQSGTSAMLSCEVNSPAVHGQYGRNFFWTHPYIWRSTVCHDNVQDQCKRSLQF